MMPPRLVLLLGLLACVGIGCRNHGAVKVTVHLKGFVPGCVRVSVKDEKTGTVKDTVVVGELEKKKPGDTLAVAVYREAHWGNTLRLEASSFEQTTCEGTPLDKDSGESTVRDGDSAKEVPLTLSATDADGDGYPTAPGSDCDDGDPLKNPGQTERCNGVDDNCDGRDEGLGVGNSCVGAFGCAGKVTCVSDTAAECEIPATTILYKDNDGDSYGQTESATTSCAPTQVGYVTRGGDCNDKDINIHPGVTDICDSKDNDCDGLIDEDVNLAESCTVELGCARHRLCATDGGTRCDYDTPPSTWYPDEDLDSRGNPDASVVTCSPDAGYVLDAGDCNDGNPFIYAGAPELCDKEDNNCDRMTDESGACPLDAGWKEQTLGSDEWRTAAVWGDGGVWIAGGVDKFLLRKPDAGLQDVSNGCGGGSWFGVSVDPGNGTAYFGGTANRTASFALPPSTTCTIQPNAPTTDVKGMVSMVKAGGGLDTFIVGVDNAGNASTRGHAYWGGASGAGGNATAVGPLFDVHGISRELTFGVGGIDPVAGVVPGAPQIYRFNPNGNGGAGDWASEGVDTLAGAVADRLRGVWVVNNKLAYAVGESNGMLKWNGTAWSAMTGPAPGQTLHSVLAFGSSAVYVVTSDGRVFRFNGSAWTSLYTIGGGAALYDIAGSRPDDLWVVGAGGKLAHWPQ